MDTELKAVIKWISDYTEPHNENMKTVLALAEIGRLAVERTLVRESVTYVPYAVWQANRIDSSNRLNDAIDAFLAARKGGE